VQTQFDENLVGVLASGKLAVLRTDTLYGIVASAEDEAAVSQVHTVKVRSDGKALIVLIASPEQAYDGSDLIAQLTNHKDPTSVIVPSPNAPSWLQHADGTVAYRVPVIAELRELLTKTGPLVAPSANPEGKTPARTIDEAKDYFGEVISAYVDGGEVAGSKASIIIKLETDGSTHRLR